MTVMTVAQTTMFKFAHVNMMTDTMIANLSPNTLRSIMRYLLAVYPSLTAKFEEVTRDYLLSISLPSGELFDDKGLANENFFSLQTHIRCMLGCNLCYQSLTLLGSIVEQTWNIVDHEEACQLLAPVDADIVQAATALQKSLTVSTGFRDLSPGEHKLVDKLYSILSTLQDQCVLKSREFPFERGLTALASLLGRTIPVSLDLVTMNSKASSGRVYMPPPTAPAETFQLGDRELPRIFSGLWQLSSPAWGAAPTSRIIDQLTKHGQTGFTAFDMADHYGDAEIIFV